MNAYINTHAEASQQWHFFLFSYFIFFKQNNNNNKSQKFSQMNISSPSVLLHFEHKLMFQQDYKAGSHLQNFPRQNYMYFLKLKRNKTVTIFSVLFP